jgi:hypothetical protein
VGPMLFGIASLGAAFMPRSGFWAVFVPAILAFGVRGRGREGSTRGTQRKERK